MARRNRRATLESKGDVCVMCVVYDIYVYVCACMYVFFVCMYVCTPLFIHSVGFEDAMPLAPDRSFRAAGTSRVGEKASTTTRSRCVSVGVYVHIYVCIY